MMHSYDRRGAYWLSLLVVSLAPGLAWAADNGIYIGGSFAQPSSDYDWSAPHGSEDHGNGFKAIIGARPFDWLGIEANYTDVGESTVQLLVACPVAPCPDQESFDAEALSVSALGMWALPLVDLYARLGTARWETERQVRFGPEQGAEGTDVTYGVGIQGRIGGFALRFEYEHFDFDRDDAELLSVGFTYTFL